MFIGWGGKVVAASILECVVFFLGFRDEIQFAAKRNIVLKMTSSVFLRFLMSFYLSNLGLIKLLAVVSSFLTAVGGAYIAQTLNHGHMIYGFSTALASGVLLAASMVHLLPDAEEKLEGYMDFPLAQTLSAGALVLLIALEELATALLPLKDENHTEAACATYRAQFAVNPRKELRPPHHVDEVCYSGSHEDSSRPRAISSLSPHIQAPLLSKVRSSKSEDCCPLHLHDQCGDVESAHETRTSGGEGHRAIQGHRHDVALASEIGASSLFFAMSFHSVMEGLGLGSAESTSSILPILVAILSHKALAAFALGSSLRDLPSMTQKRFIYYVLLFSLGTPFGALIGAVGLGCGGEMHDLFVGVCTAMASGTFLQISCLELLPRCFAEDTSKSRKVGKVGGLVIGFVTMSILAKWV